LNISNNSILSKSISDASSASLSSENLLKFKKENYYNEIDLKDFVIKDKLKKERHSYFNDKLYIIGLPISSNSLIQHKDSIINSRELIKRNNSIPCDNSYSDYDLIINDINDKHYKTENFWKKNELENSIFKHILERNKSEN
jgi:hypothetical protein